jgi:hypothetical protein
MGYVFFSPYKGPKIDLDEEFKKQGLTEEEIKELYKRWDEKLERKKKHWFWKLFKF